MTVCNMSIEAGAKAGLIAPDETTFAYLEGREHAPKGADWDAAVADWRTLRTDPDATFDREIDLDARRDRAARHVGHQPGTGHPPSPGPCPDPTTSPTRPSGSRRRTGAGVHGPRAAGRPLTDVAVDTVFIGSCTNSRIEDLRAAAEVAKGRTGRRRHAHLGRPRVARGEGTGRGRGARPEVFTDAGFDWREPGCSMCLAMNPDKLEPGERCASTSNRNFEGRQGRGGRTHLVSPAMAAATAIAGHFTTPEEL